MQLKDHEKRIHKEIRTVVIEKQKGKAINFIREKILVVITGMFNRDYVCKFCKGNQIGIFVLIEKRPQPNSSAIKART